MDITKRLANYEAVLDELTELIIELELSRRESDTGIFLDIDEDGQGRLSEHTGDPMREGFIYLDTVEAYSHREGEWTREEAEDDLIFYRLDYHDRAYHALRRAGVSDRDGEWD